MADKLLAIISMALFLIFIGFLAVYVNEINLWVVLVIVGAMALYDFWTELRTGNGANGS